MTRPFIHTTRQVNGIRGAALRYQIATVAAAHYATDRAIRAAQGQVRNRMRAVGLGRLANAVGQTSSLKKKQRTDRPYGVMYARGGRDSRAAGALDAYTNGAIITPKKPGGWLAFPTAALPKRATSRGKKMTPAGYKAAGLEARLGKLTFRETKDPNVALLVARNVLVSPKTGRFKRRGPGKTRTAVPVKEIVAFVLIKQTGRMRRFDHRMYVYFQATNVPQLMREYLERKASTYRSVAR